MNPVEHCNAIFLRSGRVLEEPEEDAIKEFDDTCSPCTKEKDEEELKEQIKESEPPTQVRTYRPHILSPQRLAKAKLDE